MHERPAERWSPLWILAAAALLCVCLIWPAIILGHPIVSPDTASYFKAGDIAGKLISELQSPKAPASISDLKGAGGHLIPNDAVGIRSAYYGVFVWLLTALTVWLVPLVQAAFAVYAIYRFLTAFTALSSASIFVTTFIMAIVTTLPWFTSYIMPDLLAGIAILLLATLLFGPTPSSRWIVFLDCGLIFFCLISHNSIFLLALSLLLITLFAAVVFRQREWAKPIAVRSSLLGVLLISTIAAQVAVSYVAFGKIALTERTPPFLVAKSVMDGPARLYLEDVCAKAPQPYFMCRYVGNFPKTENDFLWADDGIYMRATPGERARIRAEQTKVVLEAAMAYPWLQLQSSLTNIWNNLLTFNLVGVRVDLKWKGAEDGYRASEGSSPPAIANLRTVATQLSYAVTVLSLLLVIGLAIRFGCSKMPPVMLFVLLALIGNAAITGIFSSGSSRYQARVIWLMPLVAVVAISAAHQARVNPAQQRVRA